MKANYRLIVLFSIAICSCKNDPKIKNDTNSISSTDSVKVSLENKIETLSEKNKVSADQITFVQKNQRRSNTKVQNNLKESQIPQDNIKQKSEQLTSKKKPTSIVENTSEVLVFHDSITNLPYIKLNNGERYDINSIMNENFINFKNEYELYDYRKIYPELIYTNKSEPNHYSKLYYKLFNYESYIVLFGFVSEGYWETPTNTNIYMKVFDSTKQVFNYFEKAKGQVFDLESEIVSDKLENSKYLLTNIDCPNKTTNENLQLKLVKCDLRQKEIIEWTPIQNLDSLIKNNYHCISVKENLENKEIYIDLSSTFYILNYGEDILFKTNFITAEFKLSDWKENQSKYISQSIKLKRNKIK